MDLWHSALGQIKTAVETQKHQPTVNLVQIRSAKVSTEELKRMFVEFVASNPWTTRLKISHHFGVKDTRAKSILADLTYGPHNKLFRTSDYLYYANV